MSWFGAGGGANKKKKLLLHAERTKGMGFLKRERKKNRPASWKKKKLPVGVYMFIIKHDRKSLGILSEERKGGGGERGKRRVLHTNNIDDIYLLLLYIVREKVVVKKIFNLK